MGKALAMTYFLTGNPQYHRRGVVSRTCSGWEGVGPTRYGRQEFCRVVESLERLNVSCSVFEGAGVMHCVIGAIGVADGDLHKFCKVIESSRTGN